jgi:hypothetical protein
VPAPPVLEYQHEGQRQGGGRTHGAPHPGRGVARRRAGSAGESLGAEAAPRHEDGKGEQGQVTTIAWAS